MNKWQTFPDLEKCKDLGPSTSALPEDSWRLKKKHHLKILKQESSNVSTNLSTYKISKLALTKSDCLLWIYTGLPTKDKTVKTTVNAWNMTVPGLIYVFCLRYCDLIVYSIIWQRNKKFYSCRESWMETNSLNFEQTSMKSHRLWRTLYIKVIINFTQRKIYIFLSNYEI